MVGLLQNRWTQKEMSFGEPLEIMLFSREAEKVENIQILKIYIFSKKKKFNWIKLYYI